MAEFLLPILPIEVNYNFELNQQSVSTQVLSKNKTSNPYHHIVPCTFKILPGINCLTNFFLLAQFIMYLSLIHSQILSVSLISVHRYIDFTFFMKAFLLDPSIFLLSCHLHEIQAYSLFLIRISLHSHSLNSLSFLLVGFPCIPYQLHTHSPQLSKLFNSTLSNTLIDQ